MPSFLKKIKFPCIPSKKAARKGSRPGQGVKGGTTPADKVPEPDITEEKTRSERFEEENRRIRDNADELAEANRKLEEELRQVKQRLEAQEKELADKNARLQRLEKHTSELREKLAESQPMAVRNQELTARLNEKDKLLKERAAELSAAQAFLTRVDTVSEAEVVAMIDNLNTLISSASGALQEAWDQREPLPGTLVDYPDSVQIRDNFGSLMFGQIKVGDPVAVNLAVQMSLGYFIRRITSGWGGGQMARTLSEMYDMISTKESQTIASRWRTLTKRYIPHHDPPQCEEVMNDLAVILMVTRSFSEFSDAMESIETNAGTEIKAIIEATIQLDTTIKTKIASCDMSVYVISPGAVFSQETMTNEFGEDGTKEGGVGRVVAGTMEIGLLQRLGNVEKILRKPKVILEQDLVEPEGEKRG